MKFLECAGWLLWLLCVLLIVLMWLGIVDGDAVVWRGFMGRFD